MKMFSWVNKIIEFGFYALFLLTPLVFFSQTSELFEFNKLIFVYAMAVIIFGAWLIKMLATRQVIFTGTPFDLPILLYLLSRVISTFFSIDIHTSVFGYYSRFHEGLLATISYILLYYALVSNFDREKVIRLLKFGLIGGAITALWAFLEHFGHSPSCLLITGQFNADCWVQDVQSQVFATLGQPNWLGAYLCILIPITVGLYLSKKSQTISENVIARSGATKQSRSGLLHSLRSFAMTLEIGNWKLVIGNLLFYVVLLFTQSRSAFIGFWFSTPILLCVMCFVLREKRRLFLILNSIFLILTVVIGTRTPIVEKLTLPYYLSQRAATQPAATVAPLNFGISSSTEIRKVVWTGALKVWQRYPLFGSGVETFAYSYYADRTAAHNLLSEWDFLYNKAHNEYLNTLATTGAIGLLSYLTLIGTVVWCFFKTLRRDAACCVSTSAECFNLEIGIFTAWLSILITNFFGFSVVVVALYFFLLPAMMVVLNNVSPAINNVSSAHLRGVPQAQHHLGGVPSRCLSKIGNWKLVIGNSFVLFLILYSIFSILRYWQADLAYAAADRLVRAGYPTEARTMVEQAMRLNPIEPVYWDEAGTIYSTLSMTDLTDKEKMAFAEAAEKFSERATSVSPRNLTFWKSKARIFYALMKFDEKKYLPRALEAMEKAHELAPTDAKVAYNLAILYGQTGDIQKAVAQLQETIGLKINYRDAYYALGLYLREAGEQLEDKELKQHAISTLKFSLENIEPNDPEIIKKLEEWTEILNDELR